MVKDTEYKAKYNIYNNTTHIIILYRGSRVFSLEFYGQLHGAAVDEYANEAIQLLKEKGVIKTNAKKKADRRL